MSTRTTAAVGGVVLAAGFAVLAWVGWSLVRPLPAPYQYALVNAGPARQFPDLGLGDWPELPVRSYELRATETEQPLAVLHASLDDGGTPVLLDWQSRVSEPIITQTAPLVDLTALARAIVEHTPKDALLLAWWDTSRQLGLLTGRETLLDANLAEPLLLPEPWRARRAAIEALERAFWQAESGATVKRFSEYIDALLLDEQAGVAGLRKLAGERPAYLIVYLGDALKLGALRPERFGIGYRDFANSGQFHGLINRVKEWLHSHGYQSYTVDASDPQTARVYYLTEAAAGRTLLAQALSFSTSNPLALQALELLYQHGGYWVYRLPDDPPALL